MPRRLLPSVPRLALLAALLAALTPSAAHAHQQLLSSRPADGDTLSTAPRQVRLTFAQSVEPTLARLRLVGPGGEVMLGTLTVPSDSPVVMYAAVADPLVAGAYTLHWLATGDDGHPVRGELHFVLREGAVGLASVPAAATVAPGDSAANGQTPPDLTPIEGEARPPESAPGLGVGSSLFLFARWLNFGGIVVVIGAVSFATLLLGRVRRTRLAPEDLLERMRRRAATVGLAGGLCLLAALPFRLFAQAAALRGAGNGSRAELLENILTRTLWGWAWWLEAAAAVAALLAFALARRGLSSAWVLGAAAALALAVTPALSGHAAAASTVAVALDAVHVLSAGGWLGTLLVLMVAGLPPVLASATARRATAGELLGAFSPVALTFAAALTLTGVYSAWLHLPSLMALWTSEYGQTLLYKLGALVVVLAAGAYSWRRARPALAVGDDPRPLRRSATAELAFGALVLAITAALVATPPPEEAVTLGEEGHPPRALAGTPQPRPAPNTNSALPGQTP